MENCKKNNPDKYNKLISIFNKLGIQTREDVSVLPFKLPCRLISKEAENVFNQISSNNNKLGVKSTDARIAALTLMTGDTVVTQDKKFYNQCKNNNILNFNEFIEHINKMSITPNSNTYKY